MSPALIFLALRDEAENSGVSTRHSLSAGEGLWVLFSLRCSVAEPLFYESVGFGIRILSSALFYLLVRQSFPIRALLLYVNALPSVLATKTSFNP